jgi:hypothetical protein
MGVRNERLGRDEEWSERKRGHRDDLTDARVNLVQRVADVRSPLNRNQRYFGKSFENAIQQGIALATEKRSAALV